MAHRPSVPTASDLPEGSRFLISDLCNQLEQSLPPEQVQEVYRAYLFAAEAHESQQRASGEPYIYHPIAVAQILAELGMSYRTIMAAILHDVIEDTEVDSDYLAATFGKEVEALVDGVSKLKQIKFKSRQEAQAENFRKMLLAMAKDVRVILIKLADRLHNMRTLGALGAEKRRRIARETLEIYAPIASRLGINQIRIELEDLGLMALYPIRFRILSEAVVDLRSIREGMLKQIRAAIEKRLDRLNLPCTLQGRERHLYSIYQTMRNQGLSFTEVYDVYPIRILVNQTDSCYRVLGGIHSLYKPVPGHFKDYIAIPKANGYRALHTTLFGPNGTHLEVQIQTESMHRNAEYGITAHLEHEESGVEEGVDSFQLRAREWMSGLLELQRNAGNPLEFLENVKTDLFPDEIYVFTPMGEIMELPRGATVIDFAYAVHSDIGNSCVAARLDHSLVPLRTPLETGQIVRIITSPGSRPNPAWLDSVVTGKARANIRAFLKNLKQQEAIDLGRRLLERQLASTKWSLDKVFPTQLESLLRESKLSSLEALLAEIGLGNRSVFLVVKHLTMSTTDREQGEHPDRPLLIRGTEGMVVSFGKCCYPLPGDPIIGIFSAGRGMVIHNQGCKNTRGSRKHPENWVEVEWAKEIDAEFSTELHLRVEDRRGVLATAAATISEMDCNIENVVVQDRDGLTSTLRFILSVRSRAHLATVIRRLRPMSAVFRIQRIKG